MLDHPSAIKPHGRPIPFTGGSAILVTILAIGQDIVCSPRLGCHDQGMPDDNLVVCDYMNPQFHGGSVTAPFQFALYAQGSLVPALAGALGLGIPTPPGVHAAIWGAICPVRGRGPHVLRTATTPRRVPSLTSCVS